MIRTLNADDFLAQATAGVIIDVRTPAEFESGHIVGAVNIPLFSNEERAEVGTIYKQVGKNQAVTRGLEFVGPKLANYVKQARRLSKERPLFLYCWRGGMRSGSMAWLFSTAGMDVTLLGGGYKAFRLNFDELLDKKMNIMLLTGATGSGKTELLHIIADKGHQVLDLEGLANHKGSAFGAVGQQPQPTTEQYINILHYEMRKFDLSKPLWIEGESMLIGHVFLPQKLYDKMSQSTIIEVDMNIEQRLDRLVVEYGNATKNQLIEAFTKIQKRFGNDNTKQSIELVQQGDIRSAAQKALWYYDKAYVKSGTKERREKVIVVKIDNNDMTSSADLLIEEASKLNNLYY